MEQTLQQLGYQLLLTQYFIYSNRILFQIGPAGLRLPPNHLIYLQSFEWMSSLSVSEHYQLKFWPGAPEDVGNFSQPTCLSGNKGSQGNLVVLRQWSLPIQGFRRVPGPWVSEIRISLH